MAFVSPGPVGRSPALVPRNDLWGCAESEDGSVVLDSSSTFRWVPGTKRRRERDLWDKCFSLLSLLAGPCFPASDKNHGLQEGNVWLTAVSRVDTAALRRNSARLLIIIPVAGLGRWVEEKAEKSLDDSRKL